MPSSFKTLLTIPWVIVGCSKVNPIPGYPKDITSSPDFGSAKSFESTANYFGYGSMPESTILLMLFFLAKNNLSSSLFIFWLSSISLQF